MNVLLTGATGFVGRIVLERLLSQSESELHKIVLVGRSLARVPDHPKIIKHIADAATGADALKPILENVHTIIHCGGLASAAGHSYDQVLQVNVEWPCNILKAAEGASVRRFVFLSSARVLGESSNGLIWNEKSKKNPFGIYATSKCLAEEKIIKICDHLSIEYVILRPPLVIGDKQSSSIHTLWKIIRSKSPFPLVRDDGARRYISIDNLVNLITECIDSDLVKNQVYLIGDEDVITTSELVGLMDSEIGIADRRFYINKSLLKKIMYVFGCGQIFVKIFEPAIFDIEKMKADFLCNHEYKSKETLKQLFKTMKEDDRKVSNR